MPLRRSWLSNHCKWRWENVALSSSPLGSITASKEAKAFLSLLESIALPFEAIIYLFFYSSGSTAETAMGSCGDGATEVLRIQEKVNYERKAEERRRADRIPVREHSRLFSSIRVSWIWSEIHKSHIEVHLLPLLVRKCHIGEQPLNVLARKPASCAWVYLN